MESKTPRVAILMLCYNGAEDGIDALESLKDQRSSVLDIFISDNNSNDYNKNTLAKNCDRLNYTFLDRDDNMGFAGGFNDLFKVALDKSDAEYFLILNNDTEAEPDFMRNLIREAHPDKVVSPMILWHNDRKSVIQCAGDFDLEMMKMVNKFSGQNRENVPKGTHRVGQTDGCCFLIHRKWLEKGFYFEPKLFIYFEDVELFSRLGAAGVDFYYVSDSVLLHKEYGSSGGRDKPSPFRNYYFYRNRMFLAKKFHSWPKRWRIYWRLYRLAMEKYTEQVKEAPEAAFAIKKGLLDFFKGNMGRSYQP